MSVSIIALRRRGARLVHRLGEPPRLDEERVDGREVLDERDGRLDRPLRAPEVSLDEMTLY
ncbi:hypothetical protein DJ84_07880 [Halorubrum ezzemoulense]|nr:hypothetical protein DJ84_07880 [Halorubrum ezzemoulense]